MSESRTFILRNELNAKALWDVLRTWKAQADAQKPIQVVVSVWNKPRSNAQNKRYWMLLTEIQEVLRAVQGRWFSVETLHQYFKDRFAPRVEDPDGNMIAMSTADMTSEQMSEYQTAIEAYAAQELDLEF